MDARTVMLTIAFALAGGIVGWVYCLLVRYSVAAHLGPEKSRLGKFIGLMVVRVAIIGAGFFGALHFGTWPVIGYTAGFFIARTVVLSRARAETAVRNKSREIKQANG